VFDINGGEMIVLLVVAVLVIGPERLPKYAEQLAGLVKRARVFIAATRERVDSELGGDEAVDWSKLDPRQYDPRRIVRDALLDDDMRATFASVTAPLTASATAPLGADPATTEPGATAPDATGAVDASAASAAADVPAPRLSGPYRPGSPVPYDDEAT
jgi:sec-independent protein translocase protein TatB